MNRLCNFLTGATLGAGYMYYFDAVLGNRRRALVRDQINHAFDKAGDAIDTTVRDLQNRTYGLFAEARGCLTSDNADDEIIAQRVRSKMGRHVSHPSSIDVSAHNGVVHLSGPILAHEVDDLVCAVKSVRGVEDVVDNLEVHESAENISALQGGVPRTGEPVDGMQANWSPTTRLLMGAAGTALMMRCATRRTPAAALLCPVGFAMTMRAATNQELGNAPGASGGRHGTGRKQPHDAAQAQGREPHDAAKSEGQAQHHRSQHNGSGKKKPAKASGESTGKSNPSGTA